MPVGPLIVVSGPSGSGKTTLVRELVRTAEWPLRHSVSVTTRAARAGETDGIHSHYWSLERFRRGVEAGAFLEWADVFGNCYGTLREEVEPHRRRGTGVLLEIDVNGWAQVRTHCPDAVSIFIRTSTIEALEERLRERRTETEASIQRRLAGARAELERLGEYRHQVVNDRFAEAAAQLKAIVAPLFERS